MDPNHWNSLNQQLMSRVGAGGVPLNPGAMPSLLDHTGLMAAQGLPVSLSNFQGSSLGRAALACGPGFGILDPVSAGQYKTVAVGHPAYNLVDSSHRSALDPSAMYAAHSKVSLFNTDPHTMRESARSPSQASASPAGDSATNTTWNHAMYQAPGNNSYSSSSSSAPANVSHHGSLSHEPPPAHSGRPRQEDQSKYSSLTKTGTAAEMQPRQAHSNNNISSLNARNHMLEQMLKTSLVAHQHPPQAHTLREVPRTTPQQMYNNPPQHHHHADTYQTNRSVLTHNTQSEHSMPLSSSQNAITQSSHLGHVTQRASPAIMTASQPSHQAAPASKVSDSAYNSYKNSPASGDYGNQTMSEGMNYEPVSPASSAGANMNLHDFANISSHQQKMSLSATSVHAKSATAPPMPVHSGMHGVPTAQQVTNSSASVPSLNVHQTPVQAPTVQAVADSTTKTKRQSRKSSPKGSKGSRKKKPDADMYHLNPPKPEPDPVKLPSPLRYNPMLEPYAPQHHLHLPIHPAQPDNYSTISADDIGLSHIIPPVASVSEVPSLISDNASAPQKNESVFLTNTYGRSFVGDSSINNSQVEIQVVDGDRPDRLHPAFGRQQDNAYNTGATPVPMASPPRQDEDFAHFNGESSPQKGNPQQHHNATTCSAAKNLPNHQTGKPHGRPHVNPQCRPPGNPTGEEHTEANDNVQASPSTAKPAASGNNSFQNSFLSFLQGQKQETLSSVTNSAIVNKPKLPKYVPEAFPRYKPPPKPKEPESSEDKKEPPSEIPERTVTIVKKASPDLAKRPRQTPAQSEVKVKTPTGKAPPGKAPPGKAPPGPQRAQGTVILQTKPAPVAATSSTASPVGRGRPKTKVKKTPVGGRIVEPSKPPAEAEYLPLREKSSRRAKEKVREKMQAKRKKRKKEYSDESDSFDDEDDGKDEDFMPSSGSEADVRGYDSDKDPVWTPFAQEVGLSKQDSDDEGGERRGRLKRPVNKAKSKPSRRSSITSTTTELPTVVPHAITEDVLELLSDDEELPHLFEKGAFVVDRRDLTKYDNFPIWRVDAGKLLQKFEAITRDGKLLHKSESTYSSWTENIRDRFKAIYANLIERGAGREHDVAEVDPVSRPAPVNESLEENPLVQALNVYIQILVSQALEPGFLGAIQKEADEYYSVPTEKIDSLLLEKKEEIVSKVKWTTNLKENVEKYPFLTMGEEKVTDPSANAMPALRVIRLSGKPYTWGVLDELEDESMESDGTTKTAKEFLIGGVSAQFVQVYHSLHHYKYIMLKRCISKVNLLRGNNLKDQSDILDQCLQNRSWVHKLYGNFKKLLSRADTVLAGGGVQVLVHKQQQQQHISTTMSTVDLT